MWSNFTLQGSEGQDSLYVKFWFCMKAYRSDWERGWVSLRTCVDLFLRHLQYVRWRGWRGVCVCAPSHTCACAYAYKCLHSGYQCCVWFKMINHIPFFNSDSSSWQQIWFWPLKSRHVVERRLWDLRFAMPFKENVWMGLLIRKQLEAIPHRHENSMHLPCESQADWRGCDAGSVPITQLAKRTEWLTMIKCKRVC